MIERSVVLSNGPELQVALPEMEDRPRPFVLHVRGSNIAEISERARILQVLKETRGMVGGPDGAAARLGSTRTTQQSRMRKYNIARHFEQAGGRFGGGFRQLTTPAAERMGTCRRVPPQRTEPQRP